ncbi:hypothetical protein RD792_001930 [Penstemon davidsonii]|uniref:Fe2OG dioxygenase domain-containing protein n=1 Tax=Penstemon davidsonii TaxID=160366 RepID=A0ABR0DQV2_9LAMI|nr:hypothetical protein RD792_001930 [Penstemon davidsonii]
METSSAPMLHSNSAAVPKITCVRKLSESLINLNNNSNNIPSTYAYHTETTALDLDPLHNPIPTIDLSLLTSSNPHHKSKAVQQLGKACQEWGFFMVVNHGIPEDLMRAVIEVSHEFFNLAEEEKPEFEPQNVLDPIRYGTSFNTAKDKVFCWRDFLKLFVHPQFHCPDKPHAFREVLLEYCERSRQVVRKLLKGISQSLGLEECEMDKALELDSGLQIFVANLYPVCPNPEIAMGIAPHSDHGLLTLLIQNEVGGLQIQHDGEWINVNAPPNSILVNTADHLEIYSNGKYKSVVHRAVVNNEKTRISIAIANGPSADTIVCPAASKEGSGAGAPNYVPMKYKEYLLSQQSNQLNGKASLKRIQIRDH